MLGNQRALCLARYSPILSRQWFADYDSSRIDQDSDGDRLAADQPSEDAFDIAYRHLTDL